MGESKSWQKKCDVCGEWTDGNKYVCGHCGEIMEEERFKEKATREKQTIFDVAWVTIHPTDHLIVKGIKRIVLSIQIVYFGLLSFFIWMIAMISS